MISSLYGSPSIEISEHIRKILFRDMDNTMVLKLLGRNIGYPVLLNKIYIMWKPTGSLHLMDIENEYFLVKFQNRIDCDRALSEGPWIIFRQYLTVQPWTSSFSTIQPYPSTVLSWIRMPGLPRYFYRKKFYQKLGA